jgi:hypothetical protein
MVIGTITRSNLMEFAGNKNVKDVVDNQSDVDQELEREQMTLLSNRQSGLFNLYVNEEDNK